jgi:hypothetical protein
MTHILEKPNASTSEVRNKTSYNNFMFFISLFKRSAKAVTWLSKQQNLILFIKKVFTIIATVILKKSTE